MRSSERSEALTDQERAQVEAALKAHGVDQADGQGIDEGGAPTGKPAEDREIFHQRRQAQIDGALATLPPGLLAKLYPSLPPLGASALQIINPFSFDPDVRCRQIALARNPGVTEAELFDSSGSGCANPGDDPATCIRRGFAASPCGTVRVRPTALIRTTNDTPFITHSAEGPRVAPIMTTGAVRLPEDARFARIRVQTWEYGFCLASGGPFAIFGGGYGRTDGLLRLQVTAAPIQAATQTVPYGIQPPSVDEHAVCHAATAFHDFDLRRYEPHTFETWVELAEGVPFNVTATMNAVIDNHLRGTGYATGIVGAGAENEFEITWYAFGLGG